VAGLGYVTGWAGDNVIGLALQLEQKMNQ